MEEEEGGWRGTVEVLGLRLEVDDVAGRESAAKVSVFLVLVLGFTVVEFDALVMVLIASVLPLLAVTGAEDVFRKLCGKESGTGEFEMAGAAAVALVDRGVDKGGDLVDEGDAGLDVGDEVGLVDVDVGDKEVVDEGASVGVSSRGPP